LRRLDPDDALTRVDEAPARRGRCRPLRLANEKPDRAARDGERYRLFFRWRSTEAKLTRRQHIRLLTRLNRLTEANPIEAFSERTSPVHTELVAILHEHTSPPVASSTHA
jgi:hypothetical protein